MNLFTGRRPVYLFSFSSEEKRRDTHASKYFIGPPPWAACAFYVFVAVLKSFAIIVPGSKVVADDKIATKAYEKDQRAYHKAERFAPLTNYIITIFLKC